MRSPFNYRFGLPSPFYDNEAGFITPSFSPSSLFASSEPGVWYDPSDLTTLFTDTAGTTPVTTPAQTVALMLDKSKGLTLGTQLLSNGGPGFINTTGWTPTNGTVAIVGSEFVLTTTTGSGYARISATGLTSGKTYKIAFASRRLSGSGGSRISVAGIVDGPTNTSTTNQTLEFVFVATGTSANIDVNSNGGVGDYAFTSISVKELAGNHATQATAASRPTYGVVPLGGRRNLLLQTEAFDAASWSFTGTSRTQNYGIAPDGTQTSCRLLFSAANQDLRQTTTVGGVGTASAWVKGTAGQTVAFINNLADALQYVTLTGSWQQVSRTGPTSAATLWLIGTWGTATARDFEIWHPQLETGSTATAYQRVSTAFDVTEAGVQSLSYLSFDGVDDFMLTGTITPGTDKAQVFAGVRKLSDAATAMLLEFSANAISNNGAFYLTTSEPPSVSYGFRSKGTVSGFAGATLASFPAPITNVLAALGDISGDRATLRANGTQVAQSTDDQGTGNYLAYPIYIGRRGGTTLPFNGQIYSLITRFGANLDTTAITNTETWVNGKTGAYA